MVKLAKIHQIWNLPKIKNMFISQVHGNLGLGSVDDAIENVMMPNDYKWSQLHLEIGITRFGALDAIENVMMQNDCKWFQLE